MREMIDLCDNWLRVDRIELTVFADNPAMAVTEIWL
jgi:putative acetyltransferase